MSLYLVVFNELEEELEGFQVGTYHDYGRFIDMIIKVVEGGKKGTKCPTLVNHHDSDGEWSTQECKELLVELNIARTSLKRLPPENIDYDWIDIANPDVSLSPSNLYESLVDIDSEPIILSIESLCKLAIENNAKIYFQ